MHGRSRMTIDPCIPTMPGRSSSGFHRPGRHCLHQARSAGRCSASRMEGAGAGSLHHCSDIRCYSKIGWARVLGGYIACSIYEGGKGEGGRGRVGCGGEPVQSTPRREKGHLPVEKNRENRSSRRLKVGSPLKQRGTAAIGAAVWRNEPTQEPTRDGVTVTSTCREQQGDHHTQYQGNYV